MVNLYRKSAITTVFFGVVSVVQFLIGLFIMPLITKLMGTQSYGIWSQVDVTVSLMAPITNLGLGAALTRFLAAEKHREEIQEGFYSVIIFLFIVNVVAGVLFAVFATPIAAKFFDGDVQVVRLIGPVIILVTLAENYLLLIRTFQQDRTVFIFITAETCLMTGAIAFLAVNGYGIINLILLLLTMKGLKFFILFFMVTSQIGLRWPRFSRVKEFLRFGLPLAPAGIAFWLVILSDRYVIGYFLGATSVGIYSAAYNLGSFPYSVMAILTYSLMAKLPQLYDEGRIDEVRTYLRYTLKYFLAIAIPFLFGSAILGEPILRFFGNAEIANKGHLVVPIVALGVSFQCIYNIIFNILLLVKKPKLVLPIWIVAAALNIGLNIIAVPLIGLIGAAITTLMAYTLGLGVVSYYAFREFTFPIEWHFIKKSLAASVIMTLVVWRMNPHSLLATLTTVAIGVVVYGVVLVLLKGFSRTEFGFFRGLLWRKTTAP